MELILTLSSEAVSAALAMAEADGLSLDEFVEELIGEAQEAPAGEDEED